MGADGAGDGTGGQGCGKGSVGLGGEGGAGEGLGSVDGGAGVGLGSGEGGAGAGGGAGTGVGAGSGTEGAVGGDAGGKSRSFHVPGMRATGRSHVAVNITPCPVHRSVVVTRTLGVKTHTGIVTLDSTPAPGNKRPDVANIRHKRLEEQ